MWDMSKLACQEEGRGQRGEGMRRLVGGNHQRRALKDRNLLFGNHLSLAMRQLPFHLEKQHCTLALWRGPRHQAQSTLRRLPRAWPRSPAEPFLASLGWVLAIFLHYPHNHLLVLTSSVLEPHAGALLSSYRIPNPEGKASTHPPPWAPQTGTPNAQTRARTQICFQLAASLFQGFPAASNMTRGTRSKARPLMTPTVLLGKTRGPEG